MRTKAALTPDERLAIATQSMPRFLWRAVASKDGKAVLDLVFDATDIETGEVHVLALVYDIRIRDLFSHKPGFDNDNVDAEVRKVIRKVQTRYNP